MSTELRHYSWTESEKLRGYRCHTRAMVAAISEAHICKLALDQTPYFVRAFEGGRADGGILVEGSGLQGSTADRLLALGLLGKVVSSSGGPMIERTGGVVEGKKRKDRVKCFAVEVKHISPRFDGKRFLCWPIHFRKPQWDTCVAVILTSSREADYVALLPLGCIRAAGADVKLANNGALCVYGRGFQPQWMLQALPAFPPELAPFMLPSSRLRVVFDSLRSSAGGKVGAWINEHTGVTMRPTRKPPPQKVSVLLPEPTAPGWEMALEEIAPFFRGSRRSSENFCVELIDNFPFLGDFKIIYRESPPSLGKAPCHDDKTDHSERPADYPSSPIQEEIFVEAKSRHCRIERDPSTKRPRRLLHQAMSMASFYKGEMRSIFCWKASWDYIWTTVENAANQALFIPRDEVPANWWNTWTDELVKLSLEWLDTEQHSFVQYIVDTSTDSTIWQGTEAILRSRLARPDGTMRARRQIPVAPLPPKYIGGWEHSGGDPGQGSPLDASAALDEPSHKIWADEQYRRGFGSAQHPDFKPPTGEHFAAEVLQRLCRVSGRAVVLNVGRENTITRFVVASWAWSKSEQTIFDDEGEPPCRTWHLDRRTPVVPLVFRRLEWNTDHHPTNPNKWTFPADDRVLVVCDASPYNALAIPHGRFIIPSELCRHHEVRRRTARPGLDEGALFDQYLVDEDLVIDIILKFLSGGTKVPLGLDGKAGPFDSRHYCYPLETILQAGVSVREVDNDKDDKDEDQGDGDGASNENEGSSEEGACTGMG